jgi:hypothetical protein
MTSSSVLALEKPKSTLNAASTVLTHKSAPVRSTTLRLACVRRSTTRLRIGARVSGLLDEVKISLFKDDARRSGARRAPQVISTLMTTPKASKGQVSCGRLNWILKPLGSV